MKTFCKIFDNTRYGQIVVIIDIDNNRPVIQFKTKPSPTTVDARCVVFENTVEGWSNAEQVLEHITRDIAIETVGELIEYGGYVDVS